MSYQKEFLQLPEGQIADVSFKIHNRMQKDGHMDRISVHNRSRGKGKVLKVTERLEKELRKLNINRNKPTACSKKPFTPRMANR